MSRDPTETEFLADLLERDRLAALPPPRRPETWSQLAALAWVLMQVKARRKWRELRRALRG